MDPGNYCDYCCYHYAVSVKTMIDYNKLFKFKRRNLYNGKKGKNRGIGQFNKREH